jgi:hypothetical protein
MEDEMRLVKYIAVEAYIVAIWIDNAHAYIDPGAGSMIVQALIAAFIGIGIFVKQFRVALVSFITRIKNKIAGQNGDQ